METNWTVVDELMAPNNKQSQKSNMRYKQDTVGDSQWCSAVQQFAQSMDIQVEDMVKNKIFSVNLNCFNKSTKLTKYKCYVHAT